MGRGTFVKKWMLGILGIVLVLGIVGCQSGDVKEKTGFSGKKWDATIKGLTAKGILKVNKTDDGLFVEMK